MWVLCKGQPGILSQTTFRLLYSPSKKTSTDASILTSGVRFSYFSWDLFSLSLRIVYFADLFSLIVISYALPEKGGPANKNLVLINFSDNGVALRCLHVCLGNNFYLKISHKMFLLFFFQKVSSNSFLFLAGKLSEEIALFETHNQELLYLVLGKNLRVSEGDLRVQKS